jgi:hypothetical protein
MKLILIPSREGKCQPGPRTTGCRSVMSARATAIPAVWPRIAHLPFLPPVPFSGGRSGTKRQGPKQLVEARLRAGTPERPASRAACWSLDFAGSPALALGSCRHMNDNLMCRSQLGAEPKRQGVSASFEPLTPRQRPARGRPGTPPIRRDRRRGNQRSQRQSGHGTLPARRIATAAAEETTRSPTKIVRRCACGGFPTQPGALSAA